MTVKLIDLILKALVNKQKSLTQGEILEKIKKNPESKNCDELNRVNVPLSAVARQLTKYSSGSSPVLVKIFARRFQIRNTLVPYQTQLKEIDFHPALASFAFSRFNVYCKTVNALKVNKQRNNSINKWANPDIVGIDPVILKLNKLFQTEVEKLGILSTKVVQFYSFELKSKIDKSNFTECYFQAVSNSSWANFGYLVVGDLDLDKDFISNLVRLNNGYGIGVIHLNHKNPKDSQIIVSAREREVADINFMNFLSGVNKDYYEFIGNVRGMINKKIIDRDCFDKVSFL